MEAATASHHGKKWDIMYDREPFYLTERRKDVSSSSINGRKLSISTSSISSSPLAWSDGVAMSDLSSSPSLSSVLPSSTMDGNVDKVLYHNLVEMIPLVETLMDQKQTNRSFRNRAPLIYTAAPRDTSTLQKVPEHPSRGKKGHDKRFLDSQGDSNAMVAQLEGRMEELELKLQEKESLLQAAENASMQHTELLRLQATIEELQGQILTKDREIEKALKKLSEAQREVGSLHSLLETTESDIEASNMNFAKVHEESQSLQCQVAAFLLWMESISAYLDSCPKTEDEHQISSSKGTEPLRGSSSSMMRNGQGKEKLVCYHGEDGHRLEVSRRRYLASLIAARHNPTDEMLSLVAELRGQLQTYVLCQDT